MRESRSKLVATLCTHRAKGVVKRRKISIKKSKREINFVKRRECREKGQFQC